MSLLLSWKHHEEELSLPCYSYIQTQLFQLDIPFVLIKSLMKFETVDDCFILPLVYLAMAQMFQKGIKVTANNTAATTLIYISIFPFLSVLSLLLVTPPSFYFYLSFFSDTELWKNSSFWWNLFEIKDEISFFNPLSVFWFIHFSTYFFHTHTHIYKK